MNNTHTKAMKAHTFAGSPVVDWACRGASILGFAPEYRPALVNPISIQGLDPPSSPS